MKLLRICSGLSFILSSLAQHNQRYKDSLDGDSSVWSPVVCFLTSFYNLFGAHSSRWAVAHILVVIVMEAISREFRVALPWKLLYADDLVVTAETEENLIKRLN